MALALAAMLPACGRSEPPSEAPVEELPTSSPGEELTLIETLGVGEMRAHLDTWYQAPPPDVRACATALAIPVVDGAEQVASILPARVSDILALPRADGTTDWLLHSRPYAGGQGRSFTVCVDAQCREVWRDVPAHGTTSAVCRLYDSSGCVGVVLSQEAEACLVGRALDGRELFRIPACFATRALASHPRVPNLFLHVDSGLSLFENDGREAGKALVRRLPQPSGGPVSASHAVLVPGADGQPRVVAAGRSRDGTPILVSCDQRWHEDWRVKLPAEATSLVLVESQDEPPLLAAATQQGEVLVLDLAGCLRQKLQIAREGHGNRLPIRSLFAGPLPDGRRGLAAILDDVTLLYAAK